MGNAYFEHNILHKYTRMAKGQDRVEVKSTTELVLVKKYMLLAYWKFERTGKS